MGSSASKVSRAAGSAARKYPTRPAPSTTATTNTAPLLPNNNVAPPLAPATHHRLGPAANLQPQAAATRSAEINLDASDPDFAKSLRTIGPVQPNPTLSPSSAFNPYQPTRSQGSDPRSNPAIAVLDARSRLQDLADKEFTEAGRRGHEGREFLDAWTIRQILVMRDEHAETFEEIEKKLGLKRGVVGRLGSARVVELASEVGRAQKEVNMV